MRLAAMIAQDAKASGKLVIEAETVAKAYGERAIVRDLSLRVLRGDRLGARRGERRRQDHADQPADRRARAGFRLDPARRQCDRWRRSIRAAPRSSPTTTLVDTLTGGG